MKKCLVLAATAGACGALCGGTHVFDAANPLENYGGEVTVAYNADKEITSMDVTLPVQEDVRFSGDAMRFAAGAVVCVPWVKDGGRLVFENDVVAANVLTMTNAAHCVAYKGAGPEIPAAGSGTLLVAPGTKLSDVEIVGIRTAGNSVGVAQGDVCFPRWTDSGFELQVQVTSPGSSYNKCAKLRFNDSDDGIVASMVYARNLQTKQSGIDFDLPGTYGNYTIGTDYGISEIVFKDLRKPCVRFEGALTANGVSQYWAETVLTGASLDGWASVIGGEEGKVTFEGPAIGPDETNGNFTTPQGVVPVPDLNGSTWSVLASNQTLKGMSVLSSKIGGQSILGADTTVKPKVASVVCFTNDGRNASFWVQYKSGSLKSVKVHVRQAFNGNVEWCARETVYLSTAIMGDNPQDLDIEAFVQQLKDEGRYEDLQKLGINGGITCQASGNVARGLYVGGYAATEVAFAFPRVPQTKTVTLKDGCLMKGGEIAASGKVAVVSGTVDDRLSIPREAIVSIADGALFRVTYHGEDGTGYNDSQTDYRIRRGYLQFFSSGCLFHGKTMQHILLDESLLEFGPLDQDDTYLCWAYWPDTTLRNGSRIVGAVPYLVGASALETRFTVDGEAPSTIDNYLEVLGNVGGTATPDLVFDVAACGLTLTKGFVDYSEAREPVRIVKQGVGTCACGAYDGRYSTGALGTRTPATFVVEDGVWELSGSGSSNASLSYVLAGGTLAAAADTTNAASALGVTADGQLKVADGAALSFADSSAAAWADGAKVVVDADLEKATVRFGSSAAGLTRRQLKQLAFAPGADDGRHVFVLDENGYLKKGLKPGLMLIVR